MTLADPKKPWILFAVGSLVPLGCAILYSRVPPNPDQMELNYAAWQMLQGQRPYVDLMTINWPGSLWMHLSAIAAFGNTLFAWRTADALLLLATVGCLAWFLRAAFDTTTAMVGVLFYPLLFYAGGWLTGQRDFVAIQLVLIATTFHWMAWNRRQCRWQIGAGICIALAALIKPPYLLALPALLVQGLGLKSSLGMESAALRKQAGMAVLATAGVFLLVPIGLAAEGSPLSSFLEVGIQFHLQAYSRAKLSLPARVWNLSSWVVGPWWWISALAALSPLWFASSKQPSLARNAYSTVLLLLAVSLISAVWQGQGLMYHASGIYVCLVLLALLSISRLFRQVWAGAPSGRILACLVSVCFLLGVASRFRTFYLPPLQYLAGAVSARDFYSQYTAGDLTVWEALSFADRIRRAGHDVDGRDKKILVWSLANVINNESGYRDATRFHTPPVLLLAKPPFPDGELWRQLFIQDIDRAKPFACVIADDFMHDKQDAAVKYLRRLIDEQYVAAASTGKATLYLRWAAERARAEGALKSTSSAP